MNNYLKKQAAPWVSLSILAGGLVSALLLFYIVQVEKVIERLDIHTDEEQALQNLEEKYR